MITKAGLRANFSSFAYPLLALEANAIRRQCMKQNSWHLLISSFGAEKRMLLA
jgi:hypothetical protein